MHKAAKFNSVIFFHVADAVGSQCMFTDGVSLFQIKAKKEVG